MAKAAQQRPATSRAPAMMAVVADMASTFMAITQPGAAPGRGALLLMEEVAALVDTCAAKARRRLTGTCAASSASTAGPPSMPPIRRGWCARR
jgi:hypothetical protein